MATHDDADRAWLAEIIPDGAVVLGYHWVAVWIDPETGEQRWRSYADIDVPISTTLGLLELAKLDLIAKSNTGLPINYERPEEN